MEPLVRIAWRMDGVSVRRLYRRVSSASAARRAAAFRVQPFPQRSAHARARRHLSILVYRFEDQARNGHVVAPPVARRLCARTGTRAGRPNLPDPDSDRPPASRLTPETPVPVAPSAPKLAHSATA